MLRDGGDATLLSGKRGSSLTGRSSGGVKAALRREMRYHRSSKTPATARMMHGVLVFALLQCTKLEVYGFQAEALAPCHAS